MSKTPRGQVMRPTNAQQKEPTHVVSPARGFPFGIVINGWTQIRKCSWNPLQALTVNIQRVDWIRSTRCTRSFDLSCLDMTWLSKGAAPGPHFSWLDDRHVGNVEDTKPSRAVCFARHPILVVGPRHSTCGAERRRYRSWLISAPSRGHAVWHTIRRRQHESFDPF